MDAPTRRNFRSFDGLELAWNELGEGRPVLLLHGLFSNPEMNWLRFGHAAAMAARGFRVIMPHLRGHGDSAAPHDPAAYPRDVLALAVAALVAALGLTDYDLGGYSLGARTALRMVAGHGVAPRRLVLGGMGYEGTVGTGRRADHFRKVLSGLGTHPRGSPEWMAEAFLKTTGADSQALLPLLDSFVDTPPEELARVETEALVVCGAEDRDNGSAERLAGALGNARYEEVPGNHMSSVLKPELGRAIADFLAA